MAYIHNRRPGEGRDPLPQGCLVEEDYSPNVAQQLPFVVMGPGLRRDDIECAALLVSHTSALSRHESPESCISFRPLVEQRAQGKPGADRTHGSRATKSTGGRTTGVTGNSGFPCAMVLRLTSCSPRRDWACLSPPRKTQLRLTKGHRPLGRQDHTTSPSASCALVSRAISVHRIPHRVRDDRETPLDRVRRANHTLSFCSDKPKYFCGEGLRRRATQWHARVREPPAAGFPLPLRERVRERGTPRQALSVSATTASKLRV